MICVFFQAEDGIRDLVRSRGLGDVYKRQEKKASFVLVSPDKPEVHKEFAEAHGWNYRSYSATVSYTHLTLPTSDLV